MKAKKCIVCTTEFTPLRSTQRVCTGECAIKCAIEKRDKKRAQEERNLAAADRKVIRLQKEKLKTRSDWMKEAQVAFNAFIRERDKHEDCISCGRSLCNSESKKTGGSFDSGHYRSVGSAIHLRFDERNAHGQCKQCNRYGAGRAVDYRLGLIARIGLKNVEALEAEQEPKKYTIDDLKAIKATYRQKLKEMQSD